MDIVRRRAWRRGWAGAREVRTPERADARRWTGRATARRPAAAAGPHRHEPDPHGLLPRGPRGAGRGLPALAGRAGRRRRHERSSGSRHRSDPRCPRRCRRPCSFGAATTCESWRSPCRRCRGPGEVLVKVAMCGACGTDVTIQDHPCPKQPAFGQFTPGHEWTGTVVRTGAVDVDEVAVGRPRRDPHPPRVRPLQQLPDRLLHRLPRTTATRAKGHRAPGFTVDGGFAEYVVHHINAIYKLPDSMTWEDGVLATTAGTAVYGIDRAGGLVAGDTVVGHRAGAGRPDDRPGAAGAGRRPVDPDRHPRRPARHGQPGSERDHVVNATRDATRWPQVLDLTRRRAAPTW